MTVIKCKIQFFLIAIPLVILSNCIFVFANDTTGIGLFTGEYDGGRLYIAFDSTTNSITGYIEQEEGNAFCSLYFNGNRNDSGNVPLSFYSYYIGAVLSDSGNLSFTGKNVMITSSGTGSVGPCARLMSIQRDAGGESFSLTRAYALKKISVIKTVKQYLFTNPNKAAKGKVYLVKGNPVEIISENDKWTAVRLVKNRKCMGWIPSDALYK